MNLKIGLDIDGVLSDFIGGFYKWFGEKMPVIKTWENEFVNERFYIITHEKEFWMSLEPAISPAEINFPVYCYITARPIDSHITFKWLVDNGFPPAPVFGVGSNGSKHDTKVEIVKTLNLDYFVDDKRQHYEQINEETNCVCFLYETTWTEWEEDCFKLKHLRDLGTFVKLIYK